MAADPEDRETGSAPARLDPAAHYAELRAQCPMAWQASARSWLATTYEANHAGLRVPRTSHTGILGPWLALRDRYGFDFPSSIRVIAAMPFNYEGAEHARLRRLAAQSVMPFAERTELFAEVARRLLEKPLRDGRMDFAADFSNRLLFEVLADLCYLAPADREALYPLSRFSWAIEATLSMRDRKTMDDAVGNAFELLSDRAPGIIARHPDSLFAVLHRLMPEDEPDPVGMAVTMLCVFLLMGNDALGGVMASGVAWLLDPARNGGRTVPQARWPEIADDLLRHGAPIDFLSRVFHAPATVGGVDLEPGDSVMFSPLAANRDPARFGADADDISLDHRAGVGLTFGAGRHLCVGMAMSRSVVATALAVLAEAPPLRLSGPIVPGRGSIIRTIASMPVEFV